MFRSVEKYISVREEKWEERYYKALFGKKRKECGEEISKKYLEGIKWVYKYYTKGCVNWKWSYEYNSAPLLVDVERTCNGKAFELKMEMEGYNEEEQMMYVMPHGSEEEMEINEDLKRRLKERKEKIEEMEYEWSYKRYMWESEIK